MHVTCELAHTVPTHFVLAFNALHISAASSFLDKQAAIRTWLSEEQYFDVSEGGSKVWQRPALVLHLVEPGLFADRTHNRIAAIR